MAIALDRRNFVAGAGAVFLTGLPDVVSQALARSKMLFVTAFMNEAKDYGFAVVNELGELVHREIMPGRAHGFAVSSNDSTIVAFARRPGIFAAAFELSASKQPQIFQAPAGRHFYGHGVFSQDSRLLYAAENDFEAGSGKIGIYDATNRFSRIGEFDTFGVGPHEVILMRDGRTLAVANGGIRTHPDFGRAKLNLPEMKSSIVLIDSENGTIVSEFHLPTDYQRMSLRHMVHAKDGSLWIGGQYEGDAFAKVSPVMRLDPNGAIFPVDLPEEANSLLAGYVGAVALSQNGRLAGFSSPRGGGYVTIDSQTGRLVQTVYLPRNSGLAGTASGFLASSENGQLGQTQYRLHWDNHIGRVVAKS